MADAWYTQELAERSPLPVIWWNHYHRPGGLQGAQKLFQLAQQVAQAGQEHYDHVLTPGLVFDGTAPDGRLIVGWVSVMSCIERRHTEGLQVVRHQLPIEVSEDLRSNNFGFRDLSVWFLNFAFCERIFSGQVLRSGSVGEKHFQIDQPTPYAMGWANAAAFVVRGDPAYGDLIGDLKAHAMAGFAVGNRWPEPPFLP